jgi:hypothetical protein
MAGRWVDVAEAARELDVSTDAVRKRIARGSLESSREDGHVLVWLDDGETEAGHEAQVDREALIEAKEETIRTLREQLEAERRANEENRRLLAALVQRVPELEARPEPSGGPENIAPGRERVEFRPATGESQNTSERLRDTAEFPVRRPLIQPWWRRVFGR